MMKTKAALSLLILSAVLATPVSSQSYFANPQTGLNLNVGSAPNPVPDRPVQFAEVVPPVAPPPPPAPYSPPPVVQAPPPPAPPPPVPRPAVRMFVVFFDFDRADLSAEARGIVREAATTARQQPGVRVFVTGHTDTVGSRAYNQRLSERRALAVKNEMVRAGLDEDEIGTIGRNFADPLVATGPGVREPQNRRAVIDLGGAIS
jgi:outer membrane protein OmpA-like peptidoglycan-associated protein